MQQSAWQTGNINCMTVDFIAKKTESLAAYESRQCISANVGLNTYLVSGLPAEIGKTEENGEVYTQQQSFFHFQSSPPTAILYPNRQLFLSSDARDGKVATQEMAISQRKQFLIFDHSGAETRTILSPLKPPIANPTAFIAKPVSAYEFLGHCQFRKPEQSYHGVNDSYESHEDHIVGEGSDFHEDTEEINALLYSDSDDINNTNCDGADEDEVSTGRSPFTLGNGFNDTDQEEDSDDEVTSLIRAPKRHKSLASGSSNKSSSMATEPMEKRLPPQPYEDESVVDVNNCSEEPCPTVGSKRSRRDKLLSKLSILENLIPCSKSKDPLVILEEAIDYLKSLKVKANSLHVEVPKRPGCCGPHL